MGEAMYIQGIDSTHITLSTLSTLAQHITCSRSDETCSGGRTVGWLQLSVLPQPE
jgi:hypothetical protein